MADTTIVVEGKIKFREGKKWKPRWCVLKKPSPVADRLQALLYKDLTEYAKNEAKPKSAFALDSFFGLDAGFTFDREAHVLAIICLKNTSLMAFELRENMIQFEIKIRQSMGEEHQFPVKIVKAPSSCRLPKEPVRMMIHGIRFCLIAQVPPKILLSWNIEELRRFGAWEGKFCFEGGSRCGKGSGVFAVESEQAEDIADIVNLASTGKLANCHRKFKNRNSQIDFNSHLIADMSSSPSSLSMHLPDNRTSPLEALPVTLNCCHDNQTGSAESEDWSWYKRHSVSVMDHRRIAALGEAGFMDNREQLVMGIYDVPPNHGRRLDDNIWENLNEPNYAHPRPDPEVAFIMPSPNSNSCSTQANNSVILPCGDYGNYKRIVPRGREYVNNEQRQAAVCGIQGPFSEQLNNEVSNGVLAGGVQTDENNSHEESLQRLKKQESDLEREMVLLDEILQNCSAKSQELSYYGDHSETEGAIKLLNESRLSQESKQAPNQSLMSSPDHDFTIISGNISSVRSAKPELPRDLNLKKLDRAMILKLNTSMPEGTPISPLFHAKLSNLPPGSRLNAPLPYVNLSKYDDESYSHVHLPGSADSMPVTRISSMQALHDQSHGLKNRNFSLTCLNSPNIASSLLNINHPFQSRNKFSEHKPEEKVSYLTTVSNADVTQAQSTDVPQADEILVVNMDSQHQCPNMIMHAQQSLLQNDCGTTTKVSSDIVNILTADARRPLREERRANVSEIYENLPFKKDVTPPPELPPKGPALLKRLKTAANTGSKLSHTQNTNHRSRSPHACALEARSYGYDNHPRQPLTETEPPKNTDHKEDNYLIMGSPKIRHKELAPKSNTSFNSCTSPHRSHCEGSNIAINDYLGMGIFGANGMDYSNDEIYLDKDTNHHDLYISEAELRISATTKVMGESTYMEMANVSRKKVVTNMEPPKTLISRNKTGETAYSVSVPIPLNLTPQPPPRPISLKVRHNSDSGISARPSDLPTSNGAVDKKTNIKHVKSPTKVYTKIKKTNQPNQVSEPPMPFPNLIEFSKKLADNKSTYVNTYVDSDKNLMPQEVYFSRDVPLPEPVKEGFLARFKRRSSKDKNMSQNQEKSASSKNRNSVLERSISEHDSSTSAKEEKSSKLKVGRRRSSSFPNQLSYQEFLDSSSTSINKQAASSSSSFSSGSSKPKPDQNESSSSTRDFSDDSDMSPLLKRGDKKVDPQSLTVLHVQRSDHSSVNPYMQIYNSPVKMQQVSTESSKTDDEKLIEIIQRKDQTKRPIIYQRSSSLDLKKPNQEQEQGLHLKLPQPQHRKDRRFSFEKLIGCSSSLDSDIPSPHELARPVECTHYSYSDSSMLSSISSSTLSAVAENIPPSLPPKTRPYQGPLSPVIEKAPSISTLVEPIYVEMDEFLSSSDVSRVRQERDNIQATIEDDERQCRQADVEAKAGRLSQATNQEVVNEISFTTLIVPVDIILTDQYAVGGAMTSDAASLTSQCLSTTSFHDINECTNPSKSVLRPRSGQEYVVVQRKPVPSPNNSTGLSSHSPFLNSMFSYDLKPRETIYSSHQNQLLPPLAEHVLHQSSYLPNSVSEQSPSISSTAETVGSLPSSTHFHSWDPDSRISQQGHEGRLHTTATAIIDTPVQASPQPKLSSHSSVSASPNQQKSSCMTDFKDSIFFPVDMSFNASPPSSPAPHTPIYVNQEFVDKHHNTSSSTISSYSSASPIRAGVHSLMALLFKDSSKHHSPSDPNTRGSSFRFGRTRSRHSESDAHKIKQSLSLSSSKPDFPKDIQQQSPTDLRTLESGESIVTLAPQIHITSHSKVHQKEYDKFAASSIISRRRRKCIEESCNQNPEVPLFSSSTESFPKDISSLSASHQKSSGYKNIDCIIAAAVATVLSPKNLSSGPDASHLGHTSQLENILESQVTPNKASPSNRNSSVVVDNNTSTLREIKSANSVNPIPLPPNLSPLPLVPQKNSLFSPVSSSSLNSVRTSSDSSDSPPSYFAPSPPHSPPPCTPPPPALPPRIPLIFPPSPSSLSTQPEPETASCSSEEEEQELNYIEIDMTKLTAEKVLPPPPNFFSRRSKRARQQKEKDYAELRYVTIDHQATKALQQTRQEHEKCRDSSLRHIQSKDINLGKKGVHLSRINSAPASSRRKQISLMQRERKLSSGSIESF